MRDELLRRGLDTLDGSRSLASDIVLVTATSTEHEQMKRSARELGLDFAKLPGRYGPYYRIGRIGSNRVVSMRVNMGAFSPDGAAARCIQARAETQATTIILIGTAFGVDPARQRIGNVIVSESVFLYDERTVVDADPGRASGNYEVRYPTARKSASKAWQDRFRQLGADHVLAGAAERVDVGVILSGGARIESAAFRDELLARIPAMDHPVLGGEMEGMGAVSAALTSGLEGEPGWVIVKGISDFADAPSRAKIKETRAEAARASAMAVLSVLQLPPRSA